MRPADRPLLHRAVDVVVMLLIIGMGVWGFAPVFADRSYLIAGAGGALLGAALAFVGARRRWSVPTLALMAVATYLAFGGALALRQTTVSGVIPTLSTLRQLLAGAITSWRELLTVAVPTAGFDTVRLVPLLSAIILSAAAVSFALRLRRPAWALLPASAMLLVSIAFGMYRVAAPVVQGVAIAALAIGWYTWRRHARGAVNTTGGAAGKAATGRRTLAAAALVAIAVGGGGLAANAFAPAGDRHVPRDQIVPPLDLREYASPLQAFRKYVRDNAEDVLFTVDGLPEGARVRLATLDSYNGIVFNVSGDGTTGAGTFTRVGRTIANETPGTPAQITVTMGALTGPWLPDVGYLTDVNFTSSRAEDLARTAHYNTQTGTGVVTAGLQAGDVYTVDAIIPPTPTREDLDRASVSPLQLPAATGVADSLSAMAQDITADAKNPAGSVLAVQGYLQEFGFFSHGLAGEYPSRSGHGTERVVTFLDGEILVGDDEQYAVAAALMLRSLDIPARVVMGFYPDEYSADGRLEATGNNAHVWIEVPFDGYGWVAFDPAPPEEQTPTDRSSKPRQEPQPQVIPPPPPVEEPETLPASLPDEQATEEERNNPLEKIKELLLIVGGVGAVGAIVFGPFVGVWVSKSRRRRRRQKSADLLERVSGGWDEVVDTATDLGFDVPPRATRLEQASSLGAKDTTGSVATLARTADRSVFGPGSPSEHQTEAFWVEVEASVRALRGRESWRRRTLASMSARSLVRRRQLRKAATAAPMGAVSGRRGRRA